MNKPAQFLSAVVAPIILACSLTTASVGKEATQTPKPASQPSQSKPRIEVCFVLDTTGSMGGLLEGAKQKIWSIANEMISAKPTPELKLGLIGYRDRGDEYVTRTFNLTEDIDAIYAHLREFKADGGGDTPESVNEALDDAIHKLTWSQDKKVLKIVFLVGDAPPHMDYPNSPKYPELCREAAKKDLIINTVQCGDMADTRPIWQDIAKLSEGTYAAIAQSGNMAVVSTPMDKELTKLNERIGATVIPYGDAKLQAEVQDKTKVAAAAPVQAMADRLSFNSKMGKGIQGKGDLIDALNSNELKMKSIDSNDLPSEWRGLEKDELRQRIEQKRSERAALQKKVVELSKQRETYIAVETKRLAKDGHGDAFDARVAEMLRHQAAKKGINY